MTRTESNQLSSEEEKNCSEFLRVRSFFRYLGFPKDAESLLDMHRRIAERLLKLSEDEYLRERLEMTEYEIAWLKSERECHQYLTPDMIAKFRSLVDEYLRVKMGL